MEESVITINIRTGSNTKKLSLTLPGDYYLNLEPGPGPTMTTLLLDFDDGTIAVSGDAIDFQIVPVVPDGAVPLSPATSLTTSSQVSSSLFSLKNRLSVSPRHPSVASISGQDNDFNRSFNVRVEIPNLKTIVVSVSPSDSVFVLRTKIKAVNQTCPATLLYKGVPLDQNGASLGFYKICPGAEIVGC